MKFKKQFGEQEDAAAAPASNGGTPSSKWESGATRGLANPIGLTKWRDVYKITRGKANTLL